MEWQPIETAPDDGTDILIIGSASRTFHRPRPPLVAARNTEQWGEGWFTYDRVDEEFNIFPTHWMPLPPPPPDDKAGL